MRLITESEYVEFMSRNFTSYELVCAYLYMLGEDIQPISLQQRFDDLTDQEHFHRILSKSKNQKNILHWMLNGAHPDLFANLNSVGISVTKGVFDVIENYLNIARIGDLLETDLSEYRKETALLLSALPTKSAVRAHFSTYEDLVKTLINRDYVYGSLLVQYQLTDSNQNSFYTNLYGKLLKELESFSTESVLY